MKYAANPVLIEFRHSTRPTQWASKQARNVYSAALEAETSGEYLSHAVVGSVKLDVEVPTEGPMSNFGTDPEIAARHAAVYAACLRQRADAIDATLKNYSGAAFVAGRETVRAPNHPFDAETFIIGLLRRPGLRALWVHGRKFVRDTSGAFRAS